MASLRRESDRNRTGWRLQFRHHGKRRSLWLGSMSKRAAENVMRHVDELVRAAEANSAPAPETTRWARELDGRIRQTMQRWGLIEPVSKRGESDRLLGPFCDSYIAGRTDVSAATREKYGHTRRMLVECFGVDHPLKAITRADARKWQRWLLK